MLLVCFGVFFLPRYIALNKIYTSTLILQKLLNKWNIISQHLGGVTFEQHSLCHSISFLHSSAPKRKNKKKGKEKLQEACCKLLKGGRTDREPTRHTWPPPPSITLYMLRSVHINYPCLCLKNRSSTGPAGRDKAVRSWFTSHWETRICAARQRMRVKCSLLSVGR